jgi:hypothetical protein
MLPQSLPRDASSGFSAVIAARAQGAQADSMFEFQQTEFSRGMKATTKAERRKQKKEQRKWLRDSQGGNWSTDWDNRAGRSASSDKEAKSRIGPCAQPA